MPDQPANTNRPIDCRPSCLKPWGRKILGAIGLFWRNPALGARFAASLQSIRRCGQKLLMVCVGHESGRAIPYVAIVRNRLMMKALDRVRGEGSDQWQ